MQPFKMYSKRLESMTRPDANLTKYDDEEFGQNPLLKFRIAKVHDQRHFSFIKYRASLRKIQLCRQEPSSSLEERSLPETHYINNLRISARNIEVPRMLLRTEQKILSYSSEKSRERCKDVVEEYMRDVHEHFNDLMYKYSMKVLLKNPEFAEEDPTTFVLEKTDFRFKYLGRTDNYANFLKTRSILEKKLLIVTPPVRMTLNYCVQELPSVVCDFDFLFGGTGKVSLGLNNRRSGDIRKFRRNIGDVIDRTTVILRWTWYPKLIELLRKQFKKNVVPLKSWPKIFNCIESIINRQINEMKIATFQEMLKVIKNPHKIAMLRLILEIHDFNHEIDTLPNFQAIKEIYTALVHQVANACQNLERIAPLVNPAINTSIGNDYIKIELNEIYVAEFIAQMKRALKVTYQPVLDYVKDFRERYSGLYNSSSDDEKELAVFLSEPRDFEQYFSRIRNYFKYIKMLLSEPRNEYFIFAHINTEMAVRRLRSIIDSRIKLVVDQVVQQHIRKELDICAEFEEIKERALTIPKSTEELLEMSAYMIWVKKEKLFDLRDRILQVLHVANDIVEQTEMSPEHFDLTTKTINWLTDIVEICNFNASQQEQFKFTFEEHLQGVTKKLEADIEALIPRLTIIDDMSQEYKYRDNYLILLNIIDEIEILNKTVEWVNKEETLSVMKVSTYPNLTVMNNMVKPFTALLKLCIDWMRYYELWMDGPFEYLEPKFVEETTDEFLKEFQKNQKYYRNKIKQDGIEQPICKFRGEVEDPNPEKHPAPIRLCTRMLTSIKEFSTGVFVVGVMCNPALRKRHWKEMSDSAGFDMTPNAGTTLRKILNFGLDDKYDQFEIISIGAVKEQQLQDNLHNMIHEWDARYFPFGPYKETGVMILNSLDDIQALLDDHILKTLTMRGSAFMKPCEDEVLNWYNKILRVNKTLEEWGKVQSNFLYMLPIFSSKDIVAQMPEEGRLFNIVESTFLRNMGMVIRQPLVMETAPAAGLLESLEKAVELLEDITNGVNNYLEKKRLFFPRFFFLSNDEMLEILSETKDPLRVQPHLGKCFEGINRLEFDEEKNVLAMLSSEQEKIHFVEEVSTAAAGGSVEKWLVGVEAEMLQAVRQEMEYSYSHYAVTQRNSWVLKWPQMIVLCISQIYWAASVHHALSTSTPGQFSIKELFKELNTDLKDLVDLIRSTSISNLNRITIKSLIVIDVHGKDVVEELINLKVSSEYDFQWLAQLRYYWENGDSLVRIINATVPFANEYLGNSDRLVITPLTDRCYRTLVAAYQINLNGAPEGPAGTGKTETVKDLAKALAVQCKVFNCSDGLDYKAMGKFFKGLASCGAWACFDEFNRIELEVLSVIAQQILLIIQAVRAKVTKFNFENSEISLNPAVYVCITMNPGYAGRSELPDNLKVLFRAVAMMVPDYAMIGEISLYSYGFVDARKLSVKIVTTYRLCSEQLSSQNHYDYGMRAVKTVLSACGNIKKKFPNESEDILLLRSLLDVNLPKFMSFDVPLFEGIISDIFPGVVMPATDYSLIEAQFKHFCKEMILEPKQSFLTKVIQTFEMMIVRHGFMLVGDPMAGKSKTLQMLAKILGALKEKGPHVSPYFQYVEMGIMNPKAITMNQLYGSFDAVSYEWNDGIVPKIFRDFAMNPTPDRKWVIFDGPVDAVWIENMNTVLDDNKKLCLTSGEVITMTNEMSMIFEVMDLAQASPATVSRCGMIYMEVATLGWRSFYNSWIKNCDKVWATEENIKFVTQLFEWLLEPCQAFVRKNCNQHLKPGEYNCLNTTFNLFEMLINQGIENNEEDFEEYLESYFEAAMLFALVWGVAGILDAPSRGKFDNFLKKLYLETAPFELEIVPPTDGLLVDYYFTFKQRGAWRSWMEAAKRVGLEITSLGVQVPTMDTMRYIYLLEMHIKHQKRMLLVGPTGTGKSSYIQNYLMETLDKEKYESGFITFTVVITANQTQELLMSKLLKLRRGIYGPPKGKNSVLFVDDINMPVKEIYGAQPPLELLRQFFDYEYVYDLKDCSQLLFERLTFVSACGLPGGSRQEVYPRFLNHFNIYSINTFTPETVNRIFVNVLLNGYQRAGHASDVIILANQIVNATQYMYQYVQAELRATPAKSHYVFNVRDISRVITGCSLLRKESVTDKRMFARIWCHEAMRVFFDRLVDDLDRELMFKKFIECMQHNFKDKVEYIFENYTSDGEFTMKSASQLLFGVYYDEDNLPDERRYEESPTMEVFSNLATKSLEDYNSTRRNKIDITLFDFALQHLNRICRILAIQGASALLIGMGGSGRQSLTKLATNIVQTAFFQPEITKSYGPNDWHEDIKNVLKDAGGRNKHTAFLMTENQIKTDLFLQDIDCLLNIGEVPNIYAIDEKQEVLELVRLAAQGGNRNVDISPLQVFSFFVNRCKQKLHIILCMSPIGDALRKRVRLYPSLVNCCTIDWYQSWPEEALQLVAKMTLENVNVPTPEIKQSIIELCQHFHVSAAQILQHFCQSTGRYIYQTNASFLELIHSYYSLINRKQNDIMRAKMRYIGGLETLAHAAAAISGMQTELNALQPKLLQLAESSRKMMLEINTETIAASAAAEQVKKDEVVAGVKAEKAQKLKADCEKDLRRAMPVLEEALAALNTLKPADITLVKSMKNPPSVVKLVMAAVCVIKSLPPDRVVEQSTGKMVQDYWGPSKRLLGEMNFLQALKDFDKDNIPIEVMKRIRKEFISHKDFQPKIVAKASSAAEGLCKWIIAMDLYDQVAKVVAPKKANLVAAEKDYSDTMTFLEEKRRLAADLEQKVAKLNADLERANAEFEHTQNEADFCKNKLIRAEALIGGLGGEKSRWTQTAADLQAVYDNLPGDILISCGVIAYLSTVNLTYRSECVADWLQRCIAAKIPCSKTYSITETLGLDVTIQNWNLKGLPKDDLSTENAIIAANSSRYSLFIDPQGQANNWLKNMERQNRLAVVKFSQSNYMKVIAEAIEHGYPVIVENVLEELEPPLDPILQKKTFVQAGQKFIGLGDNVVLFHENFRLYLTSELRNPHFLPEVFNKVTIINFALTQSALEDQLLSIVVAKERPDLQEMRMNLISEAARNKAALIDAENKILSTISSSESDILANEMAVIILNDSRALSQDITAKQAATRETGEKIEAFRLNYKHVAAHSAIIYYSITDLPNIDPMYQFSLNWYIALYEYSIETANKSKDLPRRVKFLVEAVTRNLYNNVCRSIFEKDKLLFSFILTCRLLLGSNQIEMRHLSQLLTNAKESAQVPPNPDSSWITDAMWLNILRLEELEELNGFVVSFEKSLPAWKRIYDHTSPEEQDFPAPWRDKTTRFEKIIILKALRPDKVFLAVKNFIEEEMGEQFVTPPEFDISKSYKDSNALTPMIFILSPGADPLGSLLAFAEKMKQYDTFQSISLGQGQGPIAQNLIRQAQESGNWVCLQNCHLAVSWMPTLEYIWENMDTFNTSPAFRLWLTSYPTPNFPVALLQNGVKMTNEPPTGLKENIMRSYNSEPINDATFYQGCIEQDRAFARLLFGICFFHAVVQERRKYGPLGWNIAYGFNESDLQISVVQLNMLLNQYSHVPYDALSYLIAECNYGGRVTDTWDRRAIITILRDYVNPNVVSEMKYQFAEGEQFVLPSKLDYREVLRYIETKIPSLASPEVYGLHANAGITRDLQTTSTLLDSMISLLGSELTLGGTGGQSVDKALMESVAQITTEIATEIDIEAVKEKYPVEYNESMNTVLAQEVERFLKLQKEIRSSCRDLELAVKGIIVMTPELENVMQAIKLNRIPTKWMSKSYPSLKPLGSYTQDLAKRLNWLNTWFEVGKPATFWLSGFFFTQAFLTGAMQNFARKYKIPIDTLTFDFEVLKVDSMNTPPADGVYINGLFLEGARWNREAAHIVEQLPKVLLYAMPAIYFKPVEIVSLIEGNRYKCPLYKTAERKGVLSTTGHSTNFVTPILLGTLKNADHWIKRSVALICQTST